MVARLTRSALLFAGLMLAFAAQASAAKSIELTAEQTASIQEIASYINGFTTLQGEFTGQPARRCRGIFISKPARCVLNMRRPTHF
jgi:hypothetical protein